MIHCAFPLAQYQSHKNEILEAIHRVLNQGDYILGSELVEFEKAFASYCNVNYAIGVNSGTDSLMLALRALDVGPGDEVITTSHTALATISAIISTGANPVLVDIDPVHYTIVPECIQNAITEKTRVVIPIHLYGQSADMDEIMKIAKEHNLYVVEDCAQAIGATYKGRKTGSMGKFGCFSFYPTKNLGAIGDGGLLVTNDANLALRIKRLRQYGWDKDRVTEEIGVNSRLDELQAAILNIKLKYLDQDNKSRIKIAKKYNDLLIGLELVLPRKRHENKHVYHQYVVACENRDEIKNQLAERKILAGIHYPVPVHLHGGYSQNCVLPESGLPVTEKIVKRIMSLPIYPEMTDNQVHQVTGTLSEFL